MRVSSFFEIVLVYFKKHVYFWNLGFIVICGYLAWINFLFLLLPLALPALIWLRKNFELGWTTQKIRNLLIYKELTKQPFTPLENEVVQRYFGKEERAKLILSHDKVNTIRKKVYAIDLTIICLILIASISIVIPTMKTEDSYNPDSIILQAYGQLIGLEYFYGSTWFGQTANPSETTILFHNCSITLRADVRLELGQNYTITFNNITKRIVSIRK